MPDNSEVSCVFNFLKGSFFLIYSSIYGQVLLQEFISAIQNLFIHFKIISDVKWLTNLNENDIPWGRFLLQS